MPKNSKRAKNRAQNLRAARRAKMAQRSGK